MDLLYCSADHSCDTILTGLSGVEEPDHLGHGGGRVALEGDGGILLAVVPPQQLAQEAAARQHGAVRRQRVAIVEHEGAVGEVVVAAEAAARPGQAAPGLRLQRGSRPLRPPQRHHGGGLLGLLGGGHLRHVVVVVREQ